MRLDEVDVGPIPADHIDGNGHLSVRFIVEIAAHGAHEVLVACGLTDARRASTHQGVFTAEHHLVYLSEMRVDSDLGVYVRILDRSSRAVILLAFVVDRTRRRVTTVLRTVVVSVDLTTRRARPFAPEVAREIDRVMRRHESLSWSPPFPRWGRLSGSRRRRWRRRIAGGLL
ncbi:thioesterase family protein [Gordonia terrae]|uniref:Thioesterase n=2 Tax=Gordonia terrae TaxID=2055 RepID=A0AAD0K4Q8_9ACTN|nr:thioesterase family protein [Gordonia terrae]ANY21861.1 hypothetical protein BCM27_02700 [Gordonia terrae]AWO82595.1 thioesterase [Gordonia terrae]GAB46438.1 hypothetical protein GOTRE_159_00020 [Gordonia terrae NBRC 100016]VTS22481.1 bifunctional 3-hydroxyacyl-CoA dehydrogenase/thioesterase [Gordonia terrae]